jgi:hypothetical protein
MSFLQRLFLIVGPERKHAMQLINSPLAVVRSVRSSIAWLRLLDIGGGSAGELR